MRGLPPTKSNSVSLGSAVCFAMCKGYSFSVVSSQHSKTFLTEQCLVVILAVSKQTGGQLEPDWAMCSGKRPRNVPTVNIVRHFKTHGTNKGVSINTCLSWVDMEAGTKHTNWRTWNEAFIYKDTRWIHFKKRG